MADHEFVPGSMEITSHEKTFEGFVKLVTRAGILILVLLVLIALANA